MSIVAASLVASVSVEGADKAKSDLEGVGGSVGGMASMMAGGLATAALTVGKVLLDVGTKAVTMAGNFQTMQTSLVTGAGESQANLAMVGNGILNIARMTGDSTTELEKSMFTVESSGAHGAAGLAILTAAAEGARVGNADLNGVTEVLTTSLHNYHLAASAATGVVNSFIATTSAGKMVMSDLNGALTNVLPVAANAGVALSGVEGALATMSLAGDKGAAAGTHLSQMLMSLIKPSTAASKELKAVGLTTQGISDEMKVSLPGTIEMITTAVGKKFPVGSAAYLAAIANIVGGSKQMRAIMELSGGSLKTFIADTLATSDAMKKGGSSVVGWSDVQKDFNTQMDRAREAVETLMISIGQALLPVLSNLMAAILPVINNFATWVSSSNVLGIAVQNVGGYLSQLAGYFAPVEKYIQNAAQQFFGFGDAATKTSATVTGAVKPVSETIRHLQGMFANIAGAGGGAKTSPFASLLAEAKTFGSVIMSNVEPVIKSISGIISQFAASLKGPATEAFKSISATVGGVFTSHMQTASGIVKELGKWFQSTLMPAVRQAMPGFQSLAGVLIGTVVPGLVKLWAIGQKVVDEVMPPLVHIMEAAVPVFVKLYGIIAGGLAVALKFLMPYILQAAAAIGQFAGEVASRVAPILISFFHNLNTAVNGFMVVWKAVWPYLAPILKGVWDEITGVIKVAWALVSGIIKIGLDLLSGNWSGAWNDLKAMVSGIWDGIKQVIGGGIELVKADISAFCAAIVGFFTGLWNDLVGHSIVPDMINGIIGFFAGMPGKIMGIMGGFVSGLLGTFSNMAQQGLGFIMHLVTGSQQDIEQMRLQSAIKTLQMKDDSIKHFVQMQVGAVAHLTTMKEQLLNEIQHTTDPAKKHFLEMQLANVDHALKMREGAINQAKMMHEQMLAHIKDLKEKAAEHAAEMNKNFIDKMKDMASNVLATIGGWVGDFIGWVQHLHDMAIEWITMMVFAAIVKAEALRTQMIQKIQDLVNGVINWFVNLHNQAIQKITDFVNGVIQWFVNLHDSAVSKMQDVVQGITDVLNNFISGAAQFGVNLLKNIASGITSGISDVKGAITNVVNTIGSFLPHSPAKQGELRHLNEYGPTIMTALQKGMEDHMPALKATMEHVMQPMAQLGTQGHGIGLSPSFQFPAMQNSQPITIIVQPAPVMLDGRKMANNQLPHLVTAIRNATGVKGI